MQRRSVRTWELWSCYPYASVIRVDKNGVPYGEKKSQLAAIDEEPAASKWRLVLKSVFDITDMEAAEIIKIAIGKKPKKILPQGKWENCLIYDLGGKIVSIYKHGTVICQEAGDLRCLPTYRAAHIVDRLRSMGYDCGYMYIPSLLHRAIAINLSDYEKL